MAADKCCLDPLVCRRNTALPPVFRPPWRHNKLAKAVPQPPHPGGCTTARGRLQTPRAGASARGGGGGIHDVAYPHIHSVQRRSTASGTNARRLEGQCVRLLFSRSSIRACAWRVSSRHPFGAKNGAPFEHAEGLQPCEPLPNPLVSAFSSVLLRVLRGASSGAAPPSAVFAAAPRGGASYMYALGLVPRAPLLPPSARTSASPTRCPVYSSLAPSLDTRPA